MKKIYSLLIILLAMTSSQPAKAQGWPSDYDGVMLQAFYWDSFTPTQWQTLEAQADDIAPYFSLVWVPQSGRAANNPSMGYDPLYWYDQNSSFGNEDQLKSMIQAFKAKGTGTQHHRKRHSVAVRQSGISTLHEFQVIENLFSISTRSTTIRA